MDLWIHSILSHQFNMPFALSTSRHLSIFSLFFKHLYYMSSEVVFLLINLPFGIIYRNFITLNYPFVFPTHSGLFPLCVAGSDCLLRLPICLVNVDSSLTRSGGTLKLPPMWSPPSCVPALHLAFCSRHILTLRTWIHLIHASIAVFKKLAQRIHFTKRARIFAFRSPKLYKRVQNWIYSRGPRQPALKFDGVHGDIAVMSKILHGALLVRSA
jgi:hypothetical protein